MGSFKRFLSEGGQATKQFGTQRVFKKDIDAVLTKLSSVLEVSEKELISNFLGGTNSTFKGFKDSSKDIDIAESDSLIKEYHQKMMKLCSNEGSINLGTKVGSYAVDVGDDKKVQVDLMYVPSIEWAKFSFHSSEGDKSKYAGVVRNLLMMTYVSKMLPKIKSDKFDIYSDGENLKVFQGAAEIIRAARSLKLDVGLERLFKVAKKSKSDSSVRVKSLSKVTPDDVTQALKEEGLSLPFSKSEDIINDPSEVCKLIFNDSDFSKFMTTEDVMEWLKSNTEPTLFESILSEVKDNLKIESSRIPPELQCSYC